MHLDRKQTINGLKEACSLRGIVICRRTKLAIYYKMNSSILLAFVVAAVLAVSEAQWGSAYGPRYGPALDRSYGPAYGRAYAPVFYGKLYGPDDDDVVYPVGYRANLADQGGPISQDNDQGAYNVNYGRGDLNSNQRHQASQYGFQHNPNGEIPFSV